MLRTFQDLAVAQPSPVIALPVAGMNDVLNSQGYTQAARRLAEPFNCRSRPSASRGGAAAGRRRVLSSVYDALIAATDALCKADPSLPQHRAIVLLSDGEDNVSAHS
jgi:hypothetical protein